MGRAINEGLCSSDDLDLFPFNRKSTAAIKGLFVFSSNENVHALH